MEIKDNLGNKIENLIPNEKNEEQRAENNNIINYTNLKNENILQNENLMIGKHLYNLFT